MMHMAGSQISEKEKNYLHSHYSKRAYPVKTDTHYM